MNDRIRLAEAMGWKFPHGPTKHCPDPFTDANDDYAVLEWGVDTFGQAFVVVVNALVIDPAEYTLDDYARAALKVIE